MKKLSKIALVTGLILVIGAFAWSGFNWRRVSNDFRSISRKSYVDKQATFAADAIHAVAVDVHDVTVIVRARPGTQQVTVDYFETEDNKYQVTAADGTVRIVWNKPVGGHGYSVCLFHCLGQPSAITVYVPAESSYDYTIATSNASLRLDEAIRANTIRATTTNAHIRVIDVTAIGDVELRTSNASVDLTRLQASKVTAITDNGSITLNSVVAPAVTATSSNASINIDRLAADDIQLRTDNGRISGTIAGLKDDYAGTIRTTNGTVRIDGADEGSTVSWNSNQSKKLSAQTSDGSVHLKFVDR